MLKTEMRNPKSMHIDKMTTGEMLKIFHEENFNVVNAVGNCLESIEKAVDATADAIGKGGRLICMGAGTSGRLGVIEATECPPTFGVPLDTVIGIIAGGKEAVFKASENQEDNVVMGVDDLKNINLTGKDVVVGISAAGEADYVIKALEYAKSLGCVTIGLTSNPGTLLDKTADISIATDTGPEIITGSTRMKAGTAQKLVLNMITTCSMIKLGNVYENLMINLNATNKKLYKRMINIVCDIKNIPEKESEELLVKADWNIKKALEIYDKMHN